MVELGLATLILVPVIVVHGWCLGQVSKTFSTRFALYTPETSRWRVTTLTGDHHHRAGGHPPDRDAALDGAAPLARHHG